MRGTDQAVQIEIEEAAKSETENVRVAVSSEEHAIVLKMENEFLRLTTQIMQLQKQAENIQKSFPEHIKRLAAKYSVDLTKNSFDALDGSFKKNQ